MLYAKIVLGLPVQGPFDYIVPEEFKHKIKPGSRAWINFRGKKEVGYIVKLVKKSDIRNLKTILSLIDQAPVLSQDMLCLTKEMAQYYYCSWGQAIETALPEALRKGAPVPLKYQDESSIKGEIKEGNSDITLIHDSGGFARWDIYLKEVTDALEKNKSAILLFPDVSDVLKARDLILKRLGKESEVIYRKQPREAELWLKMKEGRARIVLGTRSGIFSPLKNLGLVIIDGEEDSVYKQEQVPHYHARDIALRRVKIEKAKLILGSAAPSLESFYPAKQHISNYVNLSRENKLGLPEIKIIDMKNLSYADRKRKAVLTKFSEDSIYSALNSKEKILLFLNRKGFATFSSCNNCGLSLKCPRCNVNLVYHFDALTLNCHYCNYSMQLPQICPNCNAGYIKYSGLGTERIESELARIFPQARIQRLDNQQTLNIEEADIFIATSLIIKQKENKFNLVCVLGMDNSLNRVDFRAAEKTFCTLSGILMITRNKLIIQTYLPGHHCFQALLKNDPDVFYEKELSQRRELGFPPYGHLILLNLRGKNEERVRKISLGLFEKLNQAAKGKQVKIISVSPGQPAKLRGNFYWQILISSNNIKSVRSLLEKNLADLRHSGIIVTIDVDPL